MENLLDALELLKNKIEILEEALTAPLDASEYFQIHNKILESKIRIEKIEAAIKVIQDIFLEESDST